jgi:poly-beta-1,6-N-acetyl-D-glucosamine synthase
MNNMKYPKISLIVPVYNERDILEKALAHMTEQIKYPNFEILLGIDGDDGSVDIARKYARKYKNIKISYSKERRGIFVAENAVMKLSTGEIIVKFDGDARFVEPDKALYNIAKNFQNPKVGALFFDCQYVPKEERNRSLTVRGEAFVMKLVTNYMSSIGTINGKWNCFMIVNSVRKNILNELKLDSIIDDIQFAYATLDKGYVIKFTPDVKYYKIGNPPNPRELFNQKKRNYKYWLRVKEYNKEIKMYLFYFAVFKYFLKNIYKYSIIDIIPFFYWCVVFIWAMVSTNISNMLAKKKEKTGRIEWHSISRVDKK